MATTGIGFRWLDILEKEFDKACVELDTSISVLETEEPEVVFGARQKIATLGSCFAQLTHKALTIFQNSAKLEAEIVDMRVELVQSRAASIGGLQDSGDAAGNVTEAARARSEAAQLARENAALRETVLALHSELFGARLATKYLDKELAGRIQQLQLLGRDMRAELRDSLWAQVEAEILLQRHKTLVRVCRGAAAGRAVRGERGGCGAGRSERGACEAGRGGGPAGWGGPAPHEPRDVRVRRSPHLGLGISVTGGREHGVPILISELEEDGPAALTGELYVGDAILAINDVDLTQTCHKDAVQALQSVKGDCVLCVQYIATDDDDRLSEDNYRFPLYPDVEADGAGLDGATPTAPRTPPTPRSPTRTLEYDERSRSDGGSGSECCYPDYSLDNKLAILDMDDHSIKIEARLQSVEGSPESTPVHGPRGAGTRAGADPARDARPRANYRTLLADRHTSHDRESASESSCADNVPELSEAVQPEQKFEEEPIATQELIEDSERKSNGDARPRREPKGFRIGSARRIFASQERKPATLTNGELEKSKFATRLLAGEGDPDFGTPV